MPKKPAKKKSLAKKQMKKTTGGMGDGSVRFLTDSITPVVFASNKPLELKN